MKTATRNIFVMLMTLSSMFACQFTPDTYDQDYLDSLKGTGGSADFNLSNGGSASTKCDTSCDRISIQAYKPRTGFAPSKSVMGLDDGSFCVCPSGSGGASSTSTGIAGASGDGSTQDPPQGGTAGSPGTTIDYPSFGGVTSNGGTTSVETATGGDGNTQDPPGTGGKGNTQDPPVTGGNGNTQDPPGTGGTTSTGGASATGGMTSTGQGGGSTQDPPPAGAAGIAGMTGTGGGSTQDPPSTGGKTGVGGGSTQDPPGTGGKMSTGGTSATGGTSSTGGTSATGGKTGTGGGTSCEKQSYKFYITQAPESLGKGTVTCKNLTTGAAPMSTTCSDAGCCYYTIPTSCDKWACHQINQSKGMPRVPSYDPETQKGILDWGASAIITTGDHYWLEEGVDYEIVCTKINASLDCNGDLTCEKNNHECDLVLNPNAGERFYQ